MMTLAITSLSDFSPPWAPAALECAHPECRRTPLAGFTLSLFRAYLASTVITERLESGTLYVVNQRRSSTVVSAFPVYGKTVLRRVLLRFGDGD